MASSTRSRRPQASVRHRQLIPPHSRTGKGDAYRYCKQWRPGAIERKLTRELVLTAMLAWLTRYGRLPSSYDWSRTYARNRGGIALKRLNDGDSPSASVVGNVFGNWQAAREAAGKNAVTAALRILKMVSRPRAL